MNASRTVLRVGTRASALARAQTRFALERLSGWLPSASFEVVELSSPGDRDRATDLRDSPPDFFTRDLDDALRHGAIDAAIHSAKDRPDPEPEDVDWHWLPWAEDNRDVVILRRGERADRLPSHACLGVSSSRRETYVRSRFPQARLKPIRGNVEDRIAQLDAGDYDAILLAAAGLLRLGLAERITEWIPAEALPPPEGQGRLTITFRPGDPRTRAIASLLVKAVRIIGAGVSAETCTAGGIKAIREADVCLHDDLIDHRLLEHLAPGARVVPVGKRSGEPSTEQEEIHRLMIAHARKGRRVVRLKGGDPGIFGRLVEEAGALDAAGIPYRVLPGVSSLAAATTGTGMVLTARNRSRGFTVITPSAAGGKSAPVGSAARTALPIAMFMAVERLEEVTRQLASDGMSFDTPAAIVYGAGTDSERIVQATLGSIGVSALIGEKSPALLIVGEASRTTWSRRNGALQGRRVLLTCSESLQSRAATAVEDRGGIPIGRPLIRLEPDPAALPQLRRIGDYDWVLVTSPSAVTCLLALLREDGMDVRRLPRIFAGGRVTARELLAHGIVADAQPSANDGIEGVMDTARKLLPPGTRVLRLRSDKAGPALADALRAQGIETTDCVVYLNRTVPWPELPQADAVFFASESAVEAWFGRWGPGGLVSLAVVAVGKPTARALEKAGRRPDATAGSATVEDAIDALAAFWANARLEAIG